MLFKRIFFFFILLLAFIKPTLICAEPIVTPIHWEHLHTNVLTDSLARQAVTLLQNGLKYAVNDWYDKVKGFKNQTGTYLNFKGNTEHYIRPVSHMAFVLAASLRFHIYNETVTNVPKTDAQNIAIKLISSLAYRHKACCGEKEGWGNLWQSAWWASQTAFAAWMLWDELDNDTRSRIYDMTVYEANRFLNYEIPYYKDKSGKVIYKGDSKSEENAWNSDLLVLAAIMFSQHPHAAIWHQRALELQLSAYASPTDINSHKKINGIRLKDFLQGSNMEENGTIVNHGIIHVDYMVAFMQNAINILPYTLAGKKAKKVSLFNGNRIYNALNNLSFNGQTMYIRSEKGEATCHMFFPEGNDWGTGRQSNYWLMDVIAYCFGFDKGMKPTAADWMWVRGKEMIRMQQRNANGAYYQSKNENSFSSREEFLLAEITFGYLFLWADANQYTHFNNSGKL